MATGNVKPKFLTCRLAGKPCCHCQHLIALGKGMWPVTGGYIHASCAEQLAAAGALVLQPPPCKHWLQRGYCLLGERCFYTHIGNHAAAAAAAWQPAAGSPARAAAGPTCEPYCTGGLDGGNGGGGRGVGNWRQQPSYLGRRGGGDGGGGDDDGSGVDAAGGAARGPGRDGPRAPRNEDAAKLNRGPGRRNRIRNGWRVSVFRRYSRDERPNGRTSWGLWIVCVGNSAGLNVSKGALQNPLVSHPPPRLASLAPGPARRAPPRVATPLPRIRSPAGPSCLLDIFGAALLTRGSGVLDVAGGKGELAFELMNLNGVPATVLDPRPLQTERYGRKLQAGWHHASRVFEPANTHLAPRAPPDPDPGDPGDAGPDPDPSPDPGLLGPRHLDSCGILGLDVEVVQEQGRALDPRTSGGASGARSCPRQTSSPPRFPLCSSGSVTDRQPDHLRMFLTEEVVARVGWLAELRRGGREGGGEWVTAMAAARRCVLTSRRAALQVEWTCKGLAALDGHESDPWASGGADDDGGGGDGCGGYGGSEGDGMLALQHHLSQRHDGQSVGNRWRRRRPRRCGETEGGVRSGGLEGERGGVGEGEGGHSGARAAALGRGDAGGGGEGHSTADGGGGACGDAGGWDGQEDRIGGESAGSGEAGNLYGRRRDDAGQRQEVEQHQEVRRQRQEERQYQASINDHGPQQQQRELQRELRLPPPGPLPEPPPAAQQEADFAADEATAAVDDGGAEEADVRWAEAAVLRLLGASAVVAMHPDQAAEPAVQLALALRAPFAVVPCCVYADEFPRRRLRSGQRVRSYADLLRYLRDLHPDVRASQLPFEGKNTLLYKL